jgi:hypothetical protein
MWFIASIFDARAVIWGSLPVTVCLIGWLWPTHPEPVRHRSPA